MAGRGPLPKPASIRRRRNHKPGAATLEAPDTGQGAPALPQIGGHAWHPLTLSWWLAAWASPMSSQWLSSDADVLGRVAILVDAFYRSPDAKILAEIRLQEQRFGLSPLDRSRLSWEVSRADEAERKQTRRAETVPRRTGTLDPRRIFQMVKK